jgi:hypothetical protein
MYELAGLGDVAMAGCKPRSARRTAVNQKEFCLAYLRARAAKPYHFRGSELRLFRRRWTLIAAAS